jgi:hypothetical protein
MIHVLTKHRVSFVLVGAIAAGLHGFARATSDVDITPATDRANLKRLTAALRSLNARVFTDSVPQGLPFEFDERSLSAATMWNLVTDAGRLDIVFEPAGTRGYDELFESAVKFDLDGKTIHAASIADIIRSKEAANRPQDRVDVLALRALLARVKRS